MLALVTNKSLDDEWNDRARAFAKELIRDQFDGEITKAAKAIGIAQGTFSGFVTQGRGSGMRVLYAMAKYTKTPVDVIVGLSTPESWTGRDLRAFLDWHLRDDEVRAEVMAHPFEYPLAAIAEADRSPKTAPARQRLRGVPAVKPPPDGAVRAAAAIKPSLAGPASAPSTIEAKTVAPSHRPKGRGTTHPR